MVDAEVPSDLKNDTEVQVAWARGTKAVETKKRKVANGKVQFNEKFEMKTMVECN